MLNKIKNFGTMAFLFALWCFLAPSAFAQPDPPPTPPPAPTAEQIAAIIKENETLKAAIEAAKKKPEGDPPPPPKKDDDPDLQERARREREAREKTVKEAKVIEAAITFNLSVDDFVKKNSDLLPKDFSEILTVANKDTYDTAGAKAAAIKASMIGSFFAVQANVDSLTPSQKADLDEFTRLTKTGKEEKAAQVYANIFEPTLEALRRIKKAEELGRSRSGLATNTDTENAYRDRLIKGSRQMHLGEKQA